MGNDVITSRHFLGSRSGGVEELNLYVSFITMEISTGFWWWKKTWKE